jgi:CPA2 family monovalent cation:H+ antiporter-2
MHGEFLQDLAVVMIVAGLVTVLCHRLRQPVVLGYIIAGVIIGPHLRIPLFVRDQHTVSVMSELGVILLMFSLGLHFSLRKLAAVGVTAFVAAGLEILLMLLIGYGIGRGFGWGRMDSLFLGAILSISSTTIIAKALSELGLAKERFADLIFGILVVEDILAIAMIALLSGLAKTGSLDVGEVATTLGGLGLFLTAVLVVGLLAVPPLLRYVGRFRSNEMMLVTALGLCFGVSLLAARLQYSVALGAFLIGAIVAEARERGKIETLVEPVRDMFSAVFFVAVGMMIDPQMLVRHAVPIAVISAAVILGKVLTCSFGAFVAGNDLRSSLRVGMGLAQIGEFSFIIAGLGRATDHPVTSEFLYPIAVTVSAVTTLLTPYLIRGSEPLAASFLRMAPQPVVAYVELYSRWMAERARQPESGRVGKLLRRWMLQIALNGVLSAAVLVAAPTAVGQVEKWLPPLPEWTGGAPAVVWLAAMVMVLPLMVVSYRKLRAVAGMVSELTVQRADAGNHTATLRGIVSGTIMCTGVAIIVMSVLVLSSALLPPWPVLLVLLGAVTFLVGLMWRRFEQLYARAQIALTETLTRPEEPAHAGHADGSAHAAGAAAPLPSILRQAELETVTVPPGSRAAGRLIRELQLRSITGASVVGIERAGESLVNPDPDEELLEGDGVLLIGTREHLEAARQLLTSTPASRAA